MTSRHRKQPFDPAPDGKRPERETHTQPDEAALMGMFGWARRSPADLHVRSWDGLEPA